MAKIPTLEDLFKKGTLIAGDDERLTVKRLPTIIPALDEILGGGLPYGRIVMMVGPESTGKTLLCQYAVVAQQKKVDRPHAALIDLERTYDPGWWASTGVDIKELIVAQPTDGIDAIDAIRAMIEQDKQLGIIIVDSIAGLSSAVLQEQETGHRVIAEVANLSNMLIKTVLPICGNIIVILINQLRESMQPYADESYPGGRVVRHFSHIILRTRREGWIEDEGKHRIGFNMEVLCKKNKTATPLGVATIPFRFRGAIDMIQSYIDDALAKNIIGTKLPYYHFPAGMSKDRIMGRNNLRQHFVDNAEDFSLMKELLDAKEKHNADNKSTG